MKKLIAPEESSSDGNRVVGGGVVGDVVLKLHLDLEMIAFAASRVQPVDDLHHHGIVLFVGRNCVIGWEKGETTPTYRSHRCPPSH